MGRSPGASPGRPSVSGPKPNAVRAVAVVLVAAVVALAAGCASDGDESSDSGEVAEAKPRTSDAPPVTAFVDVAVRPGLADDGFVGARADVEVDACRRDGERWLADGTVTNSTDASAVYRIYVAFNDSQTAVSRALIQVDVTVDADATDDWSAEAPIDDVGLACVLRVERLD